MAPHTDRAVVKAGLVALAVVLSGVGLSGCAVVKKAKTVAHDVEGNKATIDSFTTKIKSGEAQPFEATYVTTGSTPTTVVYAVQPPKGLSFTNTPSTTSSPGTGASAPNIDIIVNSSGEYSCTPPDTSGSAGTGVWSCQQLSETDATTQNAIFDFYTPAHWINFLKGFSLAAGFAGDQVTSSTMSVNGFDMSCVDFKAPGETGTSTICTTSQGILGYVKVAGDSTSFEIKSYSSTPDASLFQLPAGAKVTQVQLPSSPAT
ncbi:MAG TPA: hypothetical protein VK662_08220 [Acidothermaceae bacterium]|jgi:hypothetical protein|nr:hypothetical protein [Acidothermaceae bacterium]